MSERSDDAMISRDDLGGGDESGMDQKSGEAPAERERGDEGTSGGDSEVRGSGLGNESGLEKASGDGMDEVQERRDEINARGFLAADEEQAAILLEEDEAGSLPDPREPDHEAALERAESDSDSDSE